VPSFIRNPQDFWSGVIFIFFGLAAVIIGRDYSMGTAARMGPAYFPTILGGLLATIGAVSVVRSMFMKGEPIGKIAIRDVSIVTLSVILFGVLVRPAGLFISVIVLVMVSGFASSKFKVMRLLAVAIGLAIFSVLVFVKGLGLPMPMFGPWLGF
jgi:putative tricarboxylic transport membrane protein